jgi:hypothetical protein
MDRTAATYEKTDSVDSGVVGGGGVGERERVNGDGGVMERREQFREANNWPSVAPC